MAAKEEISRLNEKLTNVDTKLKRQLKRATDGRRKANLAVVSREYDILAIVKQEQSQRNTVTSLEAEVTVLRTHQNGAAPKPHMYDMEAIKFTCIENKNHDRSYHPKLLWKKTMIYSPYVYNNTVPIHGIHSPLYLILINVLPLVFCFVFCWYWFRSTIYRWRFVWSKRRFLGSGMWMFGITIDGWRIVGQGEFHEKIKGEATRCE